MTEQLIIVIGIYSEVVRNLGRALAEAGYAVHTYTDPRGAEAELRQGAAAVITSPYVTPDSRKRIATAARDCGVRVVMLHTGEIADTELADAVVSAVPGNVVDAMLHLLPPKRREHTA